MQKNNGNIFLVTALSLLGVGLIAGVLASQSYLIPNFLKKTIGFVSLRPLHVSFVMFWIMLGAIGCVYSGLQKIKQTKTILFLSKLQWVFLIIAIIGIFQSYLTKKFGGREYWEFDPIWALPILLSWLTFVINFFLIVKGYRNWPVYIWMWMTGILFFTFIFLENYLWIFPAFRSNFINDMTIQWKVNGSIVGAINQLLYGMSFFLMDKIQHNGEGKVGTSKLAFTMYFLGLTNLMFNWGHHIYTLPTDSYVRFVSYAISMTEWIFFIKIIMDWKKTIGEFKLHLNYFPFRFLVATEFWVFVNLGQAILMSIPVLNIFTHGTHVTVAHSMGTTIGINSMILFSACFYFINNEIISFERPTKTLNFSFWLAQISLMFLFLSLDISGILKGFWQLNQEQSAFSIMMQELKPLFIIFVISGVGLAIAFFSLIYHLLKAAFISQLINKNN
ncbi:MAG: cbb3-type cytochrome c oxidase subunit I [Flavobacteriia bacterium]|nr:cbb3-type cytochrome c oxidase subunit I [Flavobacteriia bacterium]